MMSAKHKTPNDQAICDLTINHNTKINGHAVRERYTIAYDDREFYLTSYSICVEIRKRGLAPKWETYFTISKWGKLTTKYIKQGNYTGVTPATLNSIKKLINPKIKKVSKLSDTILPPKVIALLDSLTIRLNNYNYGRYS
jgi:hypothetical protein